MHRPLRLSHTLSFQVIHQKPKKTLDEISHDLCPVSEEIEKIVHYVPYFLKILISLKLYNNSKKTMFRYLAYNSYTESVLCTGMTSMEHIASPQR
jgi:hypothetical protein